MWVIRSDGTEPHRIFAAQDLDDLGEPGETAWMSDLGWLPDSPELLFNTMLMDEGSEAGWAGPNNDLYLLDLSGRFAQVAAPGSGGAFAPSPDGRYVAVATSSQIGLWDLKTGVRRTLLEFDPLLLPADLVHVPRLQWDLESDFLMTAIASPFVFYPNEFGDEPEELWRLDVDGSAELVARERPVLLRQNVVDLAPGLKSYFYFDGPACPEGDYGQIRVRNLFADDRVEPLPCASRFPLWSPDGGQFIYRTDTWLLGNVFRDTTEPLEFLELAAQGATGHPALTWVNERFFLLTLRKGGRISLSLASLDGIVAQVYDATTDAKPRFSFSLVGQEE